MKKIEFEDGQKVSDGYVEINGTKHKVVDSEYAGNTPLSAQNLNLMQNNIEEAVDEASQTGGILTGSVIGFKGDIIPDGYEEVDNPNVYSTEEKVIGEWIDGKPLYRKVIQTILPTTEVNGTTTFNNLFFGGNIDTGFIEFAYATNTSNQNVFVPYETETGYRIKVVFEVDKLIIGNGIASYNGVPVTISVLYTKTTD